MNKQHLYTAGGMLLATTALTTVAQAAIVTSEIATNSTNLSTAKTITSLKVASSVFSTTASTANATTLGPMTFSVVFGNNFVPSTKFSVEVDITGAQFITNGVDAHILTTTALGTFLSSLGSNNCADVLPLFNKIIVDGCSANTSATDGNGANGSIHYGGITISGVTFNTASALATAGSTVSLSGSVYNYNNAPQVFENITSATILTSVYPFTATVTPAGNAIASATATPAAFDYLSSQTGSTLSTNLTMNLATVTITGNGALDKDLATAVSADATVNYISSISVTVTDTLLTSAAVKSVVAYNTTTGTALTTNATAANFSAGSATFSINNTGAGSFTSFTISVMFNGTTAIPSAGAGTVTAVFGKGPNLAQALTSATGATAALGLGGFNAELNTMLGSSNTSFTSFVRIHNNGTLSGSVAIVVKNDATGAVMGTTYNSTTIAAGQTLQLSVEQVETGAGITPAAGQNYTFEISGPITGYAQHIIFNPATGQLADLSGFRNNGSGFSLLAGNP